MNYIKRIDNYIEVDGNIIKESPTVYINRLLREEYKELNIVRKLTKKKTGITKNIPILVSNEILLTFVSNFKSNDTFLYNYLALEEHIIYKDKATLFFKDKTSITIYASRYKINESIKKAEIVLNKKS